ncbi:hypothetical protein Q5752_004412 [Cryptotrichosporon argae]
MCGRYALGAAAHEIFDALDDQYPVLYRRLRRQGGDEVGAGGGGGGGGRGGRGGGRRGARDGDRDEPQRLRGGDIRWDRRYDFRPSYNIAPKQRAPVIRADGGEALIETMQWGLIPHWTKHPPTGPLNTINARSEGLVDPSSGGMWHALKGHKRCVVPAQGYYEWHKRPSAKVAHFARLPLPSPSPSVSSSANPPSAADAAHPPLLFFAGLYDTVHYASPVPSKFVPRDGDDRAAYPTGNPVPLSTYTILTTTPASDIAWLHDRMPCVLRTEDEIMRWLGLEGERGWIDGKDGTGTLLKSTSGLDCYPVPPEVGKIGHDSPSYILPVSERADGIKSFFQKQSPVKPKAGTGARESEAVKKEAAVKPERAAVESEHGEQDGGVSVGRLAVSEAGVKTEGDEGRAGEDSVKEEVLVGVIDEERQMGMGDDSNAPNAEAEGKPDGDSDADVVAASDGAGVQPAGKRKRSPEIKLDEAEGQKKTRRGGHQTKVVRKDTGPKEQPAITSFFKAPAARKKK